MTFCPGSEGPEKKGKRSPLFSCARGQKRRQMRPRHSHSEPDSEPPGLISSSSAAQEVNLSTGTLQLWKTCCQPTTKPRKVLFWGVPPSVPPEPGRAFRVRIPKLISNTLAELTLFPQQAGAPRAQAPRPQGGDLARAAAPRSRSSQRFPQSWGRIVRPEPKGFAAPGHLQPPGQGIRPTPRNPWISDPQPRKSPIFGDPPFFDFLTGVRTSECRHRRLWLMVRKGARCALAIAIRSLILSPPA